MTSAASDWLGVRMKSNVLSAGSASDPARTRPCTLGSANVNGAKVTEVDALAPTLTGSVSI